MTYSPLRYPGGKGKILSFMKDILKENDRIGCEYVEPYVGGAAVALGLLIDGFVSKIHINDLDPAIHALWDNVINNNAEFIRKIENIDISIEEWRKQKEIYANADKKYDSVEIGFAAFFLNRCNYSGVIKGGPIGGIAQSGKWKLNERFNKVNLIKKIELIGKYQDKITLYNQDTYELLSNHEKQFEKALIYLDPPYYNKADQLYKNHYTDDDHKKIAKLVKKLKGLWIVSYDNTPEIVNLYDSKVIQKKEFNIQYSAGHNKNGKEVMFFAKKVKIPERVIC